MTNEYIHITDDSVIVETPLPGEHGDAILCRRQTVMTKEIFIKCYEKWILNNNKEDSNA